jgi:hypothetical protein
MGELRNKLTDWGMWSQVMAGLIIAAILAVLAAVFAGIWPPFHKWLFLTIPVDRLQISLWMALALIAGGVMGMVAARPRDQAMESTANARFRPVAVEDHEYEMEWQLREDPKNWVHLNLREQTPYFVKQILAGPYHLKKGCRNDLYFQMPEDRFEGPKFRALCPRCDYGNDEFDPPAEQADLNRLRTMALGELQRLHRNGVDLTNTVTLEQPHYGTEMVSVKRGAAADPAALL